jgi:hypothetical protein
VGNLGCVNTAFIADVQYRHTREVIGNLLAKLAAQHRVDSRMRRLRKLGLRKWHCMTSLLYFSVQANKTQLDSVDGEV